MKAHTTQFKDKIKEFGREIDSKITYTINGVTTELGAEQLNSVSPHYEGAILKSVMKQLDIDSNVEIPIGTELNYRFGIKTDRNSLIQEYEQGSGVDDASLTRIRSKNIITIKKGNVYKLSWSGANASLYKFVINTSAVSSSYPFATHTDCGNNDTWTSTSPIQFTCTRDGYLSVVISYLNNGTITPQDFTNCELFLSENNGYDFIDYGNYIVKDVEKQEDTNSYKITCYDKMLYAMKNYENLNITYPITVRNYINAICTKLGLTFKNANTTFANYNRTIPSELYLDADGRSLGYTFRDVLDELAEVTGSTICINEDDELEIRYPTYALGKNLFNANANNYTNNHTTYNLDNKNSVTVYSTGTWSRVTVNVTDLKSNTQYTISSTVYNPSGAKVGLYESDYNFDINNATSYYSKITITSNASGELQFQMWSNWSSSSLSNVTTFDNIQIEEGNVATNYEPYGDTIDEEYLKDVNVDFGKKYGAINTLILSRSAGSDKISQTSPSNLPDDQKIAVEISDNQILNGNDREYYMSAILNELLNVEYYINDFSSTGVCYYDLCDKYNVKIDGQFYSCLMLNNEVNITQGLTENIYTEAPPEAEQQYQYMSTTDQQIKQAYIIVNKQKGEIEAKVSQDDIIASLNLAIEDEQGIVRLTGNQVIIDSDYFKLNADGTIQSTGGTIGGYKITDNMLYAEIFAPYDYNNSDLTKIYNYLIGTGSLTPEEFEKYDVNKDGVVNSLDYIVIYQFIRNNVTTTKSTKIIMRTGSNMFDNAYVLLDGDDNTIVRIGFNGIYYRGTELSNSNKYSNTEIAVGKWINDETIYRKVINFGSLPNAATKSVAHGITGLDEITKIEIIGTDGAYFFPIPFSPVANMYGNVSSSTRVDSTNINIYASGNWSTYTAYVILEYTKN